MLRFILLMSAVFIVVLSLEAQQKVTLQLSDLKGIHVVNRKVTSEKSSNKKFLKISEDTEEGLVWLPITDFSKGTIELTMRGKDEFQKSFIGIAFHGVNDSNYDAVYCRPFNFSAKDSIRRIHAIQYISMPAYNWNRLREERNAVFEKEIKNPPDPNGWFTLRLVIDNKVAAFINDQPAPSLFVDKISSIRSGKIGLLTGDSSGGDFEKITIEYK